jgi:hypothetical protein
VFCTEELGGSVVVCAGSECESSGAESDEEGQDRDEHGGAGVEKRKCCGSCVVNSRREWWFAR